MWHALAAGTQTITIKSQEWHFGILNVLQPTITT